MKKALLTGSFDPPTLGHLDIIQRASYLCEKLYIGIGINPSKETKSLLSVEEKKTLLKQMCAEIKHCEILSFEGLSIDLAKKENIDFLIRGLRAFSDFEYEFRMAIANKKMAHIETIFLMADVLHTHVNSSLIREIAHFKGPIESFVPENVAQMIKDKELF